MSRTCEHPKENYKRTHGQSNNCPECRSHVCLRCGVVDNISWSSGVCDGCYRIRERENREQHAKWDAEARRQERERIWAEGHAAGRQDEYCGGDVCNCTCEVDGAPQTQAEVTAGYVNPSTARLEAWANKQELTR